MNILGFWTTKNIERQTFKIGGIQKNGIYLGKNLILTYEAEGCYLNIKDVEAK